MMDDIVSPVLLTDEDKCRRNIRNMASKADASGVNFRPHFKTHQSHTIGRWFREAGVKSIAVSSFSMAEYFARDQWQDIMVAFPVNIRETEILNRLAGQCDLSVLIADADTIEPLGQKVLHDTGFYIKIDVGNHRSGFLPDQSAEIESLLQSAARFSRLKFRGFVAHAGQTYQTSSLNEVQKIYSKGGKQLVELTRHFRQRYPGIKASWGDTPTCSLVNTFEGVDEIRPGNFVFYDLMQYQLASCDWEDIALAVAAPVVARRNDRKEVVLYAGAVHLSKDSLLIPDVGSVFGEVVKLTSRGWNRFPQPIYVNRVSQEHGIFHCPDEFIDEFVPGSLAGIIPVHSCLTVDLLRNKYYNLKTGTFFKDDH